MTENNGYITREKLAVLPNEKEISLPELGGKIKIKALTLSQRNRCREMALTNSSTGEMDMQKFQTLTIIEGMVEPKLEIGDIDFVGNLLCGVTDKILSEIYRISGIDLNSIEAKKNG